MRLSGNICNVYVKRNFLGSTYLQATMEDLPKDMKLHNTSAPSFAMLYCELRSVPMPTRKEKATVNPLFLAIIS